MALLEQELQNSNRRNAELATELRAAKAKISELEEYRRENISLRNEVALLRHSSDASTAVPPKPIAPSPASPGAPDFALLRQQLDELASDKPASGAGSYQPGRWQGSSTATAVPTLGIPLSGGGDGGVDDVDPAEVERAIARARDEAALEDAEEARLRARLEALRKTGK